MLRLIVFLIVIYILYKVARGLLRLTEKTKERSTERAVEVKGEDLVEDPYCHTHVPVSQAYEATVDGVRRYFCGQECYEQYKKKIDIQKMGR